MPLDKPYPIRTALVSVFDKTGLEPLAKALTAKGVALYSTGGTATALEKLGLSVTRIEEVTQFPEMMDGRVKTLHPKVFGGILARREVSEDLESAKQHQIPLFDLIVVNLYPFWEHKGKSLPEQIKFIDIGGPSMIRAAAKNHAAVTVLSHPSDYSEFLKEWNAQGGTREAFRHQLAIRTFQRTADYDLSIATEWAKAKLPTSLSLSPQTTLRYGENPHQAAAWAGPQPPPWQVLQGKELSYNNLLDTEAALRIVEEFQTPAVAIIKHNNPCGAATADSPLKEVYQLALATDSKSAFGGIIAVNRRVDRATAEAMAELFLEVVIAPQFDTDAVEAFSKKKNLRLITWEKPTTAPFEVRSALGGWLIQEADRSGAKEEWKTVTKTVLPKDAEGDVRFAWLLCKHVRSNAIVIARNGATVGIGAGQMSRVDAVNIALQKADPTKLSGAVLASDAFFPFRDNIDLLKGKAIRAIVQPGGSQRDAEVIQACDELGISMVFTGHRHFRH